MLARTQFILAHTGMILQPDAMTLGRERLGDVMPSIAILTEALNNAHLIIEPENWTQEKHSLFGPAALTHDINMTQPPRGVYSTWFHFRNETGGFTIHAGSDNDQPKLKETTFMVDVNAKGSFDFLTQNSHYGTVRKETLADANAVAVKFGEWMQRNFDIATLREVEAWVPKIEASKQSIMPQPRSDWTGRFAPSKLTA